MKENKFIGEIKKGKLNLDDKERFVEFLYTLSGRVELTLKKFEPTRSISFNRYYRLYLRIIEQETGDSHDDLHEFFKQKFLQPRFKIIQNEEIKFPPSTTKLNTKEFSEYITKIQILTGIPAPSKLEDDLCQIIK